MIRDIPPLAVEGVDPWEKVQIDPGARRLAEYAAAAAGLAVEEWLERAIRRACPSAFRTASIIMPTTPVMVPTFAAPPAPPRPIAPPPAPAAPLARPPEIEASLAALLAMTQRQPQPQPLPPQSPPPVEARYAAPAEPLPPAPPAAPAIRPAVIRPAPVAPMAAPEPPTALRRAPTIAERLARQRFDESEIEDEPAAPFAPQDERSDERDWHEADVAPRMFADGEEDDSNDGEPKRRFKLWAARDDADRAEAAPLRVTPVAHKSSLPSRKAKRRLAIIAVGIALAVTAGAVTAQYLIPGHSGLPRLSSAPSSLASSSSPMFAPSPSNPPPLPAFNNVNNAPSSSLSSVPNLPPASANAPLPNSSGSDLAMPSSLPPVPGLPSLPADSSAAPTNLAALPPSPPLPSPMPRVAPTQPPLPLPSFSSDEASPPTAPVTRPEPPAPAKAAPLAKGKAAPSPSTAAAAPISPPVATPPVTTAAAAISGSRPGKTDANDVAPTDPKALAPWLEQRAKAGDAIAQYRLGVLYALGQGVQQDYQHAAQLFRTSADGGVAEAQYNIAVMYGEGLGIGRDPTLAVQWYQKAAAQGNANAAFNLGVAYSNGVGVQQSMDQAAQWFRRAAASGIINAQFNLGLLYERGDGVPVSQVEAYAWYTAAAAHGDAGAAQRRDRLASTLAPSTLKEAQARAQQVAATIQSSGSSTANGALATGAATKASAPTPLKP